MLLNVNQLVNWLVVLFNAFVAIVVAFAVLRSLNCIVRGDPEGARLSVTNGILDGLFFFSVAAVLNTIHAATWDDVGKLVAILSLRTTLKFAMRRERKMLIEEAG